MADARRKLIGLLDYVEQVVRLDERVAFRLSEYRLPDGSTFSISQNDTHNLPAVRHDIRDDEGAVWLEVERLSRKEPPAPPIEIADWLVLSADPARPPDVRSERIITVTAAERDVALANGEVRVDDVLEAPRKRGAPENSAPRFDLKLRLVDRPNIVEKITGWIAETWTPWSIAELPRRRTISLYQVLYKIFQLMEVGGAESPIELLWGIGVVRWHKDGHVIDRPLLERRVEIELDDTRGGLIRIRPTSAEALFDLKPYEELGCANLSSLSDLIRREIHRTGEEEGVSPFARESFEPILSAAGARLDPEGTYSPDTTPAADPSELAPAARLSVSDKWVLFARPRSQHVILQDIDRMRRSAEDEKQLIEGLPLRLVTEPSVDVETGSWQPLSTRIGGSGVSTEAARARQDAGDVFFPKPFNDDQIEIVRRLSRADGLVVQGPPGTGKTHTIANLICHAMATGQRVLVVSRGEAALAVLKVQLPKEVQPLAISVLSNERQGLRQIESAIREIQGVVEGTQPENRRATITRLEKELEGLQKHIQKIDNELDAMASAHLMKMGPKAETPAELAQRVVADREKFHWFIDRPLRFASETGLADRDFAALSEARRRCGELIDHLNASLPSPSDLPDASTIGRFHEDLVAAAQQEQAAADGPARSIRITAENAVKAHALAQTLTELARTYRAAEHTSWILPFRRLAITGEPNPWQDRLRERINEWASVDSEQAALLTRSVELPTGLIESTDACEAVARASAGQRLWPLMTLGKGPAKALVNGIRLDGTTVKEGDQKSWRHVDAVIQNGVRIRQVKARWEMFANEIGAPATDNPKSIIEAAGGVLRICDDARKQAPFLGSILANEFSLEILADDSGLCTAVANQILAAASSVRLAVVQQDRRRTLEHFAGDDRTSVLARRLLEGGVGNPRFASDKITGAWAGILKRLGQLKNAGRDFETIKSVTASIAAAGAPDWAKRLSTQAAIADDPLMPAGWREVWDHAAAEANLERIDARHKLLKLAQDRDAGEKQCRKLFGEIVRERTFYQLDRRLSPAIKAALVEFVRALARIGKGTGKTAWAHRKTARDAMAKCYGAVPCWIMPTWRVAEQLPAELGVLDLVIIDEASQSDITELPALLRGKKILVVGDDRQVSPTAPFVTQEKIGQLRHHYLGEAPFKSLLEPGESIYDLMRAVFPNERLMLKEHFRCVEPIIRFSMQFYPEKMLPLRIPESHERLDPPLIDIYVPHGAREKNRKINSAEADIIVGEIEGLTRRPEMRGRSIGVISLVGAEQAEHIRQRLSETIGEEVMQRHAILCGDSATFQGSERDIVYLSMVADSKNKTALTMLRYEQRFNVAVSRARDRVVLVRSVRREELNPADLKARLIAHFENPMPAREESDDALAVCESNFERDLMLRLLEHGYRVRGQVGSLGYRIDMVVEGSDRTRLAVECDGDRFHGPEQWQQDMRRQRTLERVGWRFWRCFASSFYRDSEGVMSDLIETLTRMGINPLTQNEIVRPSCAFTEHRTIQAPTPTDDLPVSIETPDVDLDGDDQRGLVAALAASAGVAVGDKVVLLFSDDQKRMSVRLVEGSNDLEKGRLSISSPLGLAIVGAEEGEELELPLENGARRKVLIETIERVSVRTDGMPAAAAFNAKNVLAERDAHNATQDYDRPIADHNKAIRLDPNDARVVRERAFSYQNKGDYNRAIADYNEAIRLDPSDPISFAWRADAFEKKKDYDQAIRDYDEVIRLDPLDAVAFCRRGVAYMEKEDPDRAIADFDEAIRINPKFALAYGKRGGAYNKKKDYDRSIADFDDAIRLDPKYVRAYSARATALHHKGDFDRAMADLDEAIRIDPKYVIGWSNRGITYAEKGDYDRAIVDLDEAIRLDPNYANAYAGRAVAFGLKKDYDRAIADFDVAIKLDPNLSTAISNLRAEAIESKNLRRSLGGFSASSLAKGNTQKSVEAFEPLNGFRQDGIRVGDRVAIQYLDNKETKTYTLSKERYDPTNGVLAVTSPLGKRLVGLVKGDEIEFEASGRVRRVLVVGVER
jgi:tetratricopeptide (TPR) repeat protein/very-short-patch-repair endonuclease